VTRARDCGGEWHGECLGRVEGAWVFFFCFLIVGRGGELRGSVRAQGSFEVEGQTGELAAEGGCGVLGGDVGLIRGLRYAEVKDPKGSIRC
jgi:hypothetical protein